MSTYPHTNTTIPATRRPLLLGGPLLLALYVGAMALAGEAPAVDAPDAELTGYWSASKMVVGAFLLFSAAFAIAAFGAGLVSVLRDRGDRGPLPTLVAVGTTLATVGLVLDASLVITLHHVADEVDGAAVQSLHALFENLSMPITGGFGLLLAGAGFSARATGALPAGLAWPAVVLGVIAPFHLLGFATFALGGLWIAVAGVVLYARREG
jgi:hypothetical protein